MQATRDQTWQRAAWLIADCSLAGGARCDRNPGLRRRTRIRARPASDWAERRLILPDLIVCYGGKPRFVEAKQKQVWSYWRSGDCWETGIDQYLFDEYRKVAAITKWPVFLFFLHTDDRCDTRKEPWPCPNRTLSSGAYAVAVLDQSHVGRMGKIRNGVLATGSV